MAIQTGDQVLFVKVDTADDLPATPDDATLYFVTSSKSVYLGANLIANGLVRISDADYQQLTPEQQNNGTLYYRYDATDAGSFDVNVTQSPSTTNADYRILLSGSADDTAHTEGAGKSTKLRYNPSTGAFTIRAEGSLTVGSRSSTVGNRSVAVGDSVKATNTGSVAQGQGTTASAIYSHAEGRSSTATGACSHAEGDGSTASGQCSHSEGSSTASGRMAHAEGGLTIASGVLSHSEGLSTEANHRSQHVLGEYNIVDTNAAAATELGDYIEIVGNGTADDARSNARTLDWSGNEVLAGKLTVGAAPTNNMDVATKKYVDDAVTAAIAQVLAAQY